MRQFYGERISPVFIMEKSSHIVNNVLNPNEVVGEMVRIESNQIARTYVIENHISVTSTNYIRFYNIFFIDGYESFRFV